MPAWLPAGEAAARKPAPRKPARAELEALPARSAARAPEAGERIALPRALEARLSVAVDLAAACFRECRIETVFRYANVFDRALALIAAGKVDLKPLVSGTYGFDRSIVAFERAAEGRPEDVKLQIILDGEAS